jgi:hypothetical protein
MARQRPPFPIPDKVRAIVDGIRVDEGFKGVIFCRARKCLRSHRPNALVVLVACYYKWVIRRLSKQACLLLLIHFSSHGRTCTSRSCRLSIRARRFLHRHKPNFLILLFLQWLELEFVLLLRLHQESRWSSFILPVFRRHGECVHTVIGWGRGSRLLVGKWWRGDAEFIICSCWLSHWHLDVLVFDRLIGVGHEVILLHKHFKDYKKNFSIAPSLMNSRVPKRTLKKTLWNSGSEWSSDASSLAKNLNQKGQSSISNK